MKTSKRLPPLLAAALLGASALTLAGCVKDQATITTTSTACKPGGVPRDGVPVTVYVEHKNGKAKTANKKIYMCEQDWVVWQANEGEFGDPKFTEQNPFDQPFTHGSNSLTSGKPKKGTAKHGFPYTIGLVVGTDPSIDVDPRIEVME